MPLERARTSSWKQVLVRCCTSAPLPTTHSAVILAAFSLFFFGGTGLLASRKPLWTDEFYTFYTARLASVADVWEALQNTPDPMPFLTPVLTHFFGRAFGFSHVTIRLPAILGYWLLCVSIFAFLRRRVSLPLATAGMLMPITAPAVYEYAYEARGYGLLVGFGAATVLCWDLASSPKYRRWAIPGLSFCLAAAVASHLYGVLLVLPLIGAELARTKERGRLDFGVWLGLACAGLIALPLAPSLANARIVGRSMAGSGTNVRNAFITWLAFLSTPLTYFGLFVILSLPPHRSGALPPKVQAHRTISCMSDWILSLGLVSMPFWAYLLVILTTNVFMFRYLLPTIIGMSILIPLLLRERLRHDPKPSYFVPCWLVVAALWNVTEAKSSMRELSGVRQGQGPNYLLKIEDRLPQDGLPIVVSEYHDFTRLHYYAQAPLRERLLFFTDYSDWVRSRAPLHLERYAHHVESIDKFIKYNKNFYLYISSNYPDIVLSRLIAEGAKVQDVGLNDTRNVYPRPGFLLKVVLPRR
jgi:Dolichyl-phosphate-mannose-protein mannosyltransferase